MRIAIIGQNVPFLRKKVLLDSIKGHLGVIFLTPPNISPKKACLGVNLVAKSDEILLFGLFFLEKGNRYKGMFENLWSSMLPPPPGS